MFIIIDSLYKTAKPCLAACTHCFTAMHGYRAWCHWLKVLKCSQNQNFAHFSPFCYHMTMASNAAMRQALIQIGFIQDAAQAIMEDQRIDSVVEIVLLKDDEITALCKIIRWLGGANGNEGHVVSQKDEKNLKLCAYLIKHQTKHISWPCRFNTITLNNVRAVIMIHDFEENYENPELPPKWDIWDPAKSWEQFDDYLCYTNGELNLPLACLCDTAVNRSSQNHWRGSINKSCNCKRGDDCMCTPQD